MFKTYPHSLYLFLSHYQTVKFSVLKSKLCCYKSIYKVSILLWMVRSTVLLLEYWLLHHRVYRFLRFEQVVCLDQGQPNFHYLYRLYFSWNVPFQFRFDRKQFLEYQHLQGRFCEVSSVYKYKLLIAVNNHLYCSFTCYCEKF